MPQVHALHFLFWLGCSASIWAQEFSNDLEEARRLTGQKEWAAAIGRLQELGQNARTDTEREQVASACGEAGNGAAAEGRFDVSLQANECALTLWQAIHGERDHIDVATTLYRVAANMLHLGDPQGALPKGEAALAMQQRLFGNGDHRDLATSLDSVAMCMLSLGRPQEALQKVEAALEMQERLFADHDHPDVATTLSNVAVCLQAVGRLTDSVPRLEAALAMWQRLVGESDHPIVASVLNNVAVSMFQCGRPEDALPKFEAALSMQQRLLGDRDHPSVAKSISNLAVCLQVLGRARDALPRLEAALAMYERLFGADHAEVASSLNNLASCMKSLGRPQDALRGHEAALAMCQRLFGTRDHAYLAAGFNNVASCLERMGRSRDALPKFEAALAMQQRLYSDLDHPDVATCLNNVASCMQNLGLARDALPIFESALAMHQRCVGDRDHPTVASCLDNVAGCMDDLGRAQHALSKHEAALTMFQRFFDNRDHPAVAASLNSLADCLLRVGRPQDALPRRQAALSMWQRLSGGSAHPDVAMSLNDVALCLEGLGHVEEARSYAAAATATIEQLWQRTNTISGDLRQSFFDHVKGGGAFELLQRLDAQIGNPASAFSAAERSRGRALLDLMEQQRCDALGEVERRAKLRGDAVTEGRVVVLRQQLEDATAEGDRLLHLLTQAFSATESTAEDRQARIEELTLQSRTTHDRRRQLLDQRALLVADVLPAGVVKAPAEIQADLRPDELLLEFTISSEGSLLYVVPPHGQIAVHVLPNAAEAIERYLPAVLNRFSRSQLPASRGRDPESVVADDSDAASGNRAIFTALFPAEVWAKVSTCRRVWLAPHRGLHRLPFEALTVGAVEGKTRTWLDDGPEIAYVHSGSALCWHRQRAREAGDDRTSLDLLAIGDPRIANPVFEVPERGVLVMKVSEGGEGARIGLRERDVLLTYDGKELVDDTILRTVRQEVEAAVEDGKRAQASVPLQIWRQGEVVQFEVRPGQLGIEVGRGNARTAYDASLSYREKVARVTRAGDLEGLRSLPPLRGAHAEAAAVADVFRTAKGDERVRALFGANATEPAVFDLAAKAKYLHFACHGIAEEFAGQSLSMLVLSQPEHTLPTDDGLLKLDDLLHRWRGRLGSCRLVVLSACRTQVGPLYRDEAPQALPLGFLYAGASAVIPSMWAVDDASTKELMADFYRRLLAGETDQLTAFTAAKKALRANHPDPFHWAPFIYMGSPD